MRRVAATGAFLVCLATLTYAQDVLSLLGITPQAAKQAVDSVINAGVYNPGLPAGAFKLMPAAARAEAVAAGVAWLKTYTASAEFKQKYAEIREARKPGAPEFEGTPEEEIKRADDEQKQAAEESKKALSALPADQRAQIEEAMKAAQAAAAQMNTPEMRKMRLDAIKADRANRTKQYEQETGDLEARLPGERRADDRQAPARVPRRERRRRLRREAHLEERQDDLREPDVRAEARPVEDVLPRRQGSHRRRPRRRASLAEGARRSAGVGG